MKALISSAGFVKTPMLTWPSWSVKLPLMMHNYFNIILNWLFNEVSDQAAHRAPSITQGPFAQFWWIHKIRIKLNSQKSISVRINIPCMVQFDVTIAKASMAVILSQFWLHLMSKWFFKCICKSARHFVFSRRSCKSRMLFFHVQLMKQHFVTFVYKSIFYAS